MQKLGQHFLTNKEKLREIAEVLSPKSGELIIEIGPGHGELTNELRIVNYELRIVAIEKDEELVRYLQKKFTQDKNIEIVKGDALKILPSIIHNSLFKIQNYKIVGNIPYYITGYLLRIIGELKNKPSLAVLTIQKEVAQRICCTLQTYADKTQANAEKKGKMNLLAASVQFWAEPKIIDYIPKTEFRPQPKVDGAVIKLTPFNTITRDSTEDYYKLIKILFKQPRKTILNNLVSGVKLQASDISHQTSNTKNQKIPISSRISRLYRGLSTKSELDKVGTKTEIIKILEESKIKPGDRPQNLSVEEIKKLSVRLN